MTRTSFLSLVVLLAGGCWLSESEVYDKVDRVPNKTIVRIGTIEPEEGSIAGGDQVLIDAEPLGETAAVWFGTVPATVLTMSNRQILVESPRSDTTGYVSITIESDGRTGTLDNAFYYSDGSGTFDTADPDTGW